LSVLLLRNGEFLGDRLDFVLKLVVNEFYLIFLIGDERFFDFHLFDNLKVFVFQDNYSVFENHVLVNDLTIFLSDKRKFLACEFEFLKFAVHEFDSILFLLDYRIFLFHLREKKVVLVVQSLNLKIKKEVPFLAGF
jgi:hypothetical protein